MNRRQHLKKMALGVGALALSTNTIGALLPLEKSSLAEKQLKHSVSRWCYKNIPLETLIDFCKSNDIDSIELLEPDEYRTVIKKGLTCAVANEPASGITRGFNDPSMHDYLLKEYQRLIPLAANAGIPHIICFSGNRENITDVQGLENCAQGLKNVVSIAEKNGITMIMELLNSKVDHPDYQCDHTDWGVELVKKVNSDRFKLLYDIYHMQIMEGNIIATIRENIQHIAHFHTAGVPGRKDLDNTQELNYTPIFRAIKDLGFKGFIGQEFLPKKENPLDSLLDSIVLVNQA